MLQCLERGPTLHVQRDNLTIHHCLIGVQLEACRHQSRVHPREILVLPRPDLDMIVVLDDQGSVAVELQLVGPVVALREPLHDLGDHRRDERGRRER
jgi:hypothetical protein